MAATDTHQVNTEDILFFVDKEGDSTLLHAPAVLTVDTSAELPTDTQGDDFISLTTRTPTRKERKREKRRASQSRGNPQGRRGKGNSRSRGGKEHRGGESNGNNGKMSKWQDAGEEDLDAEEMAIMMDYIQNSSVGDLSSISHLATLTDDFFREESDGSDKEEVAEVGLYESLMMGLDDEMSSDESRFSDGWLQTGSDDEAEGLYALEGLEIDSGNDEQDEENYLRANFAGASSAWDEGNGVYDHAAKKTFYQVLQADFGTSHPARHFDSGDMEIPLSRTQRRKAERRERNLQAKARKEENQRRQAAGRDLNNKLARSKGRINNDIAGFLIGVNKVMRTFVRDQTKGDSVALTPMPGAVRRLVYKMAKQYHVIPKTRGQGSKKVTVLIRTQASVVPEDWNKIVEQVSSEAGMKLQGNVRQPGKRNMPNKRKGPPGAPNQDAKPKLGTVVGQGTAPIGETNVGHRMLKAMGWSPGQALGAEGSSGLVNPLEVMVRSKRSGLGNAI